MFALVQKDGEVFEVEIVDNERYSLMHQLVEKKWVERE